MVGLELLCDWLDSPDLFEWIQFEGDVDLSPKGLDDVVAKHQNGEHLLWQVKFTVDPYDSANQLSWSWLLNKQRGRRSLLQKWVEAVEKLSGVPVKETALITNRIPDTEFAANLDASARVNVESIHDDTAELIVHQLGSFDRAIAFFSQFQFRHSHQRFEALRTTLRDRYVPAHTTDSGWHLLQTTAADWAVLKNSPPPDGRITLGILRGVLDRRRPKPIDQSFRVPFNYTPPSSDFHDRFYQRVKASPGKAIALWGSPGQGKSTYLSYLTTRLRDDALPFLRHHYFLAVADLSDRHAFPVVANSLQAQMEAHHSQHIGSCSAHIESLRDWLVACSDGYAAAGKPFIVIIDGLDHVWRENDKNIRPLESLFRYLLPVPPNMTLILGTQRIADDQLPTSLVLTLNEDDWVELPSMSIAATKAWLSTQHTADRFALPTGLHSDESEQLSELATAFHDLSGGHPLHLTYSLEALLVRHRTIAVELVQRLPPCPEGHIREYYRSLWLALSSNAKDALHLIAGSGFIWPQFGLDDCIGRSPDPVGLEIGHLLATSEAGLLPFHDSIVAFVRQLAGHDAAMSRLGPKILQWLDSDAPPFHRWGWLWIWQSRLGNSVPLLSQVSRHWIIDSIANGYPPQQVDSILAEAEAHAFRSGQFAVAIRMRWLKIRLHNGMEFQVDHFSRARECALRLAADEDVYILSTVAPRILDADDSTLHLLGRVLALTGNLDAAIECQDELRHRINDRVESRTIRRDEMAQLIDHYLELAANTNHYRPENIVQNLHNFGPRGRAHFQTLLRALSTRKDLRLLIAFLKFPLPWGMRRDLEHAIVRLAGACRAELHKWPEFAKLKKHPLVACWAQLYAGGKPLHIRYALPKSAFTIDSPGLESEALLAEHLHCLFFQVVAESLALGGAPASPEFQYHIENPWLRDAVRRLVEAAGGFTAQLKRGETPGFDFCFRALSGLSEPDDFAERRALVQVANAILEIANDVVFLTSLRRGSCLISTQDWLRTQQSSCFRFHRWRDRYIEIGHQMLPDTAIRELLVDRERQEDRAITQFNDRADTYLGLCELAVFAKQPDLAYKLLEKTTACVMSYGWRKDMTAFHVLEALDAIATVDPQTALGQLSLVVPAIAAITEYTDGDETSEAKFELAGLLSRLAPRSLVAYYDHLLSHSEWRDAERVYATILATMPLNTLAARFSTRSIWGSYEVSELRSRAQAGDAIASRILNENDQYLGEIRSPDPVVPSDAHADTVLSTPIDTEQFPPSRLSELLEHLGTAFTYETRRKALRRWFAESVEAGRGIEVLAAIRRAIDADLRLCDLSELLDECFALSLRLEGKEAAYKWLVDAHIHRHGWSEHWAKDATRDRIKTLAKVYPDRWREFVDDTCQAGEPLTSDKLVIPHARLVELLIAVGEKDTAVEICSEMVRLYVDEVSLQPISSTPWYTAS